MTKQEIIGKAFYQLPDLDESYIEVLEDMHSAIIDKACEWLREHIDEGLVIYHQENWKSRDEFIEKFRKEMEEEQC